MTNRHTNQHHKTNDWLALPGIPAGPGVWKPMPVRTLDFSGLHSMEKRRTWKLDSFVEEVTPHYNENTILMGHDLGGVVAAMAALKKRPRAVVLSGTSLGSWWIWTRWSAAPIVHIFFYQLFKGRLFLRLGEGLFSKRRFSHRETYLHHPDCMRELAKNMRPPKDLKANVKAICPVFLIWGKQEVFYPGFLATSLSQTINAPLFWNDGGHYCMKTHPQHFHQNMRAIEQLLDLQEIATKATVVTSAR